MTLLLSTQNAFANQLTAPASQYATLSYMRYYGGVTTGSTGTKNVIYSTQANTNGADITYQTSAAQGDSFKINTSGIYGVQVTAISGSANGIIEIRSATTTDNNQANVNTLASTEQAVLSDQVSLSWVGFLPANNLVWSSISVAPSAATSINNISIARLA